MAKILKNNSIHINKEKKFHLSLSACFSYLLIISLIFSGISLAKYTASSSDTDSARVTHFSVSATEKAQQNKLLSLDNVQGTSDKYEFEVCNDSEIAVKYTVIVNNLPVGVNVNMDSQTVTSSEGSSKTEFDAINLNAGDTKACELTFTALDSAESGTFEGITVDVQFDQID